MPSAFGDGRWLVQFPLSPETARREPHEMLLVEAHELVGRSIADIHSTADAANPLGTLQHAFGGAPRVHESRGPRCLDLIAMQRACAIGDKGALAGKGHASGMESMQIERSREDARFNHTG